MKDTVAEYCLSIVCCPGYIYAADKFCKKFLGISKKKEMLFVIFSFCGFLLLGMTGMRYPIPHMLLVTLNHIFFAGLIVLLFRADREKKILAASMVIAVMTLAGNFCDSFLSCLTLFFLHTVKSIAEPFLEDRAAGLITCVSFAVVAAVICRMSEYLKSVFYEKPGKWYAASAIPLFVLTAVVDVANWGASNGILIKGGENMGLYYDQIFSHAGICVLTGLSMSAAGFCVAGMNRIYLEQEKSRRYHTQIAVYEMLEQQYRQSERLRHDMKNHIIALRGLFRDRN